MARLLTADRTNRFRAITRCEDAIMIYPPPLVAPVVRHCAAAGALAFAAAGGSSAAVTLPPPPPPAPPVVTTQFGTAIAVGDGTARSYLIEQDGVPTEIGVALTQGAAENLPGWRIALATLSHSH
jgi:hypothetical protein